MAASGGWRPLSGLVCTMAISVGQGNLILYFQGKFRKKLKFKILSCGYHVKAVTARTFKLRISTWATIFPVIYKCVKRKMKK